MRKFYQLSLRLLFLSLFAMGAALPVSAQFGGGGGGLGGGLGGGGGGLGGGGGTIGAGTGSGVVVDAEGTLQQVTVNDPTGALARQRAAEGLARLEGDLAKPSELRKISLTRLEKLIRDRIAVGSGPDDAMKNLAGLTRVEYVFCYPDTGDIVIAGPAEPWAEHPSGRTLGIETGRPIIELQDLIVALRAFPAHQTKNSPLIYCSIDPTPEGLNRMQEFLIRFGRSATPNDTQFIVNQLRDRLGPQVITVGGVSPKTHFAQVLVEADYRMKLIGIGLERPPVRLTSYVERANPAMVSRNALQRWYFVPDYQCVRVSDDQLAMQLEGNGVKLVGEDELIAQDGSRQGTGTTNRASSAFVNAFTKTYPKLAERSPVYAQLRNCIDLSIAAAFIQQQDFYGQVGTTLSLFQDEATYPVEIFNAPERVASAVNSIWKGHTLMTPIGGGVEIRPTRALMRENLLNDEQGQIKVVREELDLRGLSDDQWWWD